MQVLGQALMVLIAGLGVGWLAGLSHGEVASSLIAGLVAAVGGVLVGLKTVRSKSHSVDALNALPITILIVGISAGAPLGIMARTRAIFGKETKTTMTRVIDGKKDVTTKTTEEKDGGLYKGPMATACEALLASAYDDSLPQFRSTFSHFSPELAATATVITDAELLKKIAIALCETSEHGK